MDTSKDQQEMERLYQSEHAPWVAAPERLFGRDKLQNGVLVEVS